MCIRDRSIITLNSSNSVSLMQRSHNKIHEINNIRNFFTTCNLILNIDTNFISKKYPLYTPKEKSLRSLKTFFALAKLFSNCLSLSFIHRDFFHLSKQIQKLLCLYLTFKYADLRNLPEVFHSV